MTNTNSIYDTSYIIYKHTNTISGKSYIGKTIHGLNVRWKSHISTAKNKSYNSHFHNAIRKYGVETWEHEILFVSFLKDDDYLYEIEEELIQQYNTVKNGYNILFGGSGTGSGENNPFYGRTHSEETKQRMRDSKKGENHPMYGKSLPEKTKRKLSDSTKGEKNYRFKGYYITPWGQFSSRRSCTTELCSYDSVVRWCKNSHKTVSRQSLIQSQYLNSLSESPLGKTFKELGFGFETS